MSAPFHTKAYISLLLLLLIPMAVKAVEPAGFVLMASGKVYALQSNQESRLLKRRSPFYPGETLRTELKSKAQVRFRDGSLISLRPETEIRIDEFRFDEKHLGEDKNIFTLINGGFRTITGKIGKNNPGNYEMKSSVASIGVRGTTYEVVLDNGLDVAAWQGTIEIKNDSGKITLGAEGLYNFAQVASSVARPVGRMRPPASISNHRSPSPSPNTKQREDDSAGDNEEVVADEKKDVDEPKEKNRKQSAQEAPTRSTERDANTEPDADAPVMQHADRREGAPPGATKEKVFIETGSGDRPVLNPPPQPPPDFATVLAPPELVVVEPVLSPPFDPTPGETPDPRVADVDLNRLGIYQVIDNVAGFDYTIAKAGVDSGGELHFAGNGFKPDQIQFTDAPFLSVLSKGAAPELNLFSDGVYPVSWGIWDGVAQPVELALDPADAQSFTPINAPVHWLTVDPTAIAAVNAKTGTAEYRNVIAFDGIGNDGNLMDLFMNLGVDFDSGSIVGDMYLYTANDVWDVSLSGNVSAPMLAITNVAGQLNGSSPVSGEVNMIFTGNNAQALAGMASFEVVGSPALFLDSMFLLDDMLVGDLRLAPAEISGLNRIGLAMESNPVPGVHYLGGKASAGMNPIFVDNGFMPGDPQFDTAPVLDVLRQGDATLSSFFDDPKYPVSWGIWGAPGNAIVQLDEDDPLLIDIAPDPIVWMTVQPTPDMVLASHTGAAHFHSAPMMPATQGLSNVGPGIDSLSVDLEVSFELGLFKGHLWVETNAFIDDWSVEFDGFLDGPRLAVTGMNAGYTDGVVSGGASGSLFMILTGAQPNAIAGGFDLEYDANPNIYVQGNFIAERDLRLGFAEAAGMEYVALTAFGSPGILDTFVGRSTNGSGGAPVIGESPYYDPSLPEFWLAMLGSVYRQGSAPVVSPMSDVTYQVGMPDPDFEVSWGAWNGQATPFERQTDPIDANVKNGVNQDMYWITLLPSPVDQITGTAAGRSGILMYANDIAIFGSGSDGAIDPSTFLFMANLDFDSGNITSGTMDFDDVAANNWSASFTGTLNGATLQIATPTVQYNFDSITPTTGQINAVLTGPNAEGIGGSFDFDYGAGAKSVEGVFLVNCVGDPSC